MTCRNFRYDLLRGGAGNGSPTSDHRRTSFETAAPVFDRKVPRAGCTRNNRILSLPPFAHGIAPSRYGGIATSIDGERPALMLWWFRRPIRAVPCSSRALERSEEPRVGTTCVSTFRSRWSPFHSKTKQYN